MNRIKHIFFDLDTTLTPSRAEILPQHKPLFEQLCHTLDVIVVSGGSMEQFRKQLPVEQRDAYYVLSQQGNHALDKHAAVLWDERVSEEQEARARAVGRVLISAFQKVKAIPATNESDTFENRGSILAASVVGFHAPNEIKYAADPDQSIRRKILAEHAKEISDLRAVGLDIMPAGTTTFDIILQGRNKGFNIARFIEKMGWKKEDCLYVGDALFPGGNDESVIGVIPTRAVKGPDETFDFIKHDLLS